MINAVSSLRMLPVAAPVAPAANAAGATPNANFADVLAEVSTNAVARLEHGEATALRGIEGSASVQQVVEAIMSAEQTLQTAIAIRDKVVSAYQEISRMQI